MSSQEDNRQSQFIDEVQLRFLNNNDIGDLKRLCVEWFPLRYVHFYISLFVMLKGKIITQILRVSELQQ